MKSLRIDPDMKEKWPQTRVGCLQYQVKVEKKNEDMFFFNLFLPETNHYNMPRKQKQK